MGHFNSAFVYLIANEGQVVVNDPVDKGGLTKFGVTQRSWSYFWETPASSQSPTDLNWAGYPPSVADITLEQAKAFYLKMYWQVIQADNIEDLAVATTLFDASVLNGCTTAVKVVQNKAIERGFTGIKADGVIGPKTLNVINTSPKRIIIGTLTEGLQKRYLDIVAADATQRKFLRTWLRRASAYLEISV